MTQQDDSEAGLLELSGEESKWIWAFTCPARGCECRTAVVLAAPGDREALMARCAPVREAWLHGEDYATAAALLDVTAFALDIDDGEAYDVDAANPFTPLDLAADPDARDVVDRIDGEVLDAVARLWLRGKGEPDPESSRREAKRIEVVDWTPGEPVSWSEALVGARQDFFRVGERVFAAVDLYCVADACDCDEVIVDFRPIVPRGAPFPGAVRVERSGDVTFEPEHAKHRERLEQLWVAFQKRHPRWRQRCETRSAAMHGLAGRIVGVKRQRRGRRTAK
jgi:hypothetical protein